MERMTKRGFVVAAGLAALGSVSRGQPQPARASRAHDGDASADLRRPASRLRHLLRQRGNQPLRRLRVHRPRHQQRHGEGRRVGPRLAEERELLRPDELGRRQHQGRRAGQAGSAASPTGRRPGDWRLATMDEWMAIFRPGCYPSPGGPTIPDKTGNACYAGGTPWAHQRAVRRLLVVDDQRGNAHDGLGPGPLQRQQQRRREDAQPVRVAGAGRAMRRPGDRDDLWPPSAPRPRARLEPPGPPAPTMVTLKQIHDRQHAGSDTCFDNAGTNRFVDCATTAFGTSNGTVKDTVTGLIWLKNANCFGLISWADANIKAGALASGQCGLADGSKPGDWRLPTLDELHRHQHVWLLPVPGRADDPGQDRERLLRQRDSVGHERAVQRLLVVDSQRDHSRRCVGDGPLQPGGQRRHQELQPLRLAGAKRTEVVVGFVGKCLGDVGAFRREREATGGTCDRSSVVGHSRKGAS